MTSSPLLSILPFSFVPLLSGDVNWLGNSAEIGAEIGLALDTQGNRMCYIGYCVSKGFTLNIPPQPAEASAEVGITLSLWTDASKIPGTLNLIELSGSGSLFGIKLAMDLGIMFGEPQPGTWGTYEVIN